MTVTLETPTARPAGAPALTYPERTLIAGDLDAGLVLGYTAGNTNAPGRKWITRSRAAYAAFRKPHGYAERGRHANPTDGAGCWGKSERYALGLMLTLAATLDTAQFLPGSRPVNVCPMASKGCAAACLSQSGHGQFLQRNAPGKSATRFCWPIHSMPA